MEDSDIFKRETRNKTTQGDKAIETKSFSSLLASTFVAVVSSSIVILIFRSFTLGEGNMSYCKSFQKLASKMLSVDHFNVT